MPDMPFLRNSNLLLILRNMQQTFHRFYTEYPLSLDPRRRLELLEELVSFKIQI